MLLIVTKILTGIASHVPLLRKCLDERNIPYVITRKCDPEIIRRKDITGIIIPGSPFRIRPNEIQDNIELYYLFHLSKLPVLGICHGCQFLMLYYGGELEQYNNYWSGSKDIELDLSRRSNIQRGRTPAKDTCLFPRPSGGYAGSQESRCSRRLHG